MRTFAIRFIGLVLTVAGLCPARADSDVIILDVPDYGWHAGCFGTATGNLMGYWDRNGLPGFYTGPTGGGIAPLDSRSGNAGIRSMWASEAGVDGRPSDKPGHINDYWRDEGYVFSGYYESAEDDPYVVAGRAEHEPDCIGDFIGLSQKKWTGMAGECDGNINAYSFVYWDKLGARRTNFSPPADAGGPPVDIQSGLREWAHWRGYEADVFTQLADFNPTVPAGTGFTFEDVKAEINAGYPLMVFMQPHTTTSRSIPPLAQANPPIHGMLVFGYFEEGGTQWVYYRTSWGDSGGSDYTKFSEWSAADWTTARIPVRGVIGFRPHPKLTSITRIGEKTTLQWDGPESQVYDGFNDVTTMPHQYVVEKTSSLSDSDWQAVGPASSKKTLSFSEPITTSMFFRVRLLN